MEMPWPDEAVGATAMPVRREALENAAIRTSAKCHPLHKDIRTGNANLPPIPVLATATSNTVTPSVASETLLPACTHYCP